MPSSSLPSPLALAAAAQAAAAAPVTEPCGDPKRAAPFRPRRATGVDRSGRGRLIAQRTYEGDRLGTVPRTLVAPAWDIVGDIHGCHDELEALLDALGYRLTRGDDGALAAATHPDGRRLCFLGDQVDRGPHPLRVIRSIQALEFGGHWMTLSNHDARTELHIRVGPRRDTWYGEGSFVTERALDALPAPARRAIGRWLVRHPARVVLESPDSPLRLHAAHAGVTPDASGSPCWTPPQDAVFRHRWSFGDLLDRWADRPATMADERGVMGHFALRVAAPVCKEGLWLIDTGCCYGTALSALRFPEETTVSVPSRQPAVT